MSTHAYGSGEIKIEFSIYCGILITKPNNFKISFLMFNPCQNVSHPFVDGTLKFIYKSFSKIDYTLCYIDDDLSTIPYTIYLSIDHA